MWKFYSSRGLEELALAYLGAANLRPARRDLSSKLFSPASPNQGLWCMTWFWSHKLYGLVNACCSAMPQPKVAFGVVCQGIHCDADVAIKVPQSKCALGRDCAVVSWSKTRGLPNAWRVCLQCESNSCCQQATTNVGAGGWPCLPAVGRCQFAGHKLHSEVKRDFASWQRGGLALCHIMLCHITLYHIISHCLVLYSIYIYLYTMPYPVMFCSI